MTERKDLGAICVASTKAATPELRSHKPKWYETVTYAISDRIYGPNATARQTQAVAKFVGPENPFNAPAQITRGIADVAAGMRRGDAKQVLAGVAEVAMASVPILAAVRTPTKALASKSVNISRFPDRPQRPFHEDFPNSVAPSGAPLTHTIDGQPLTAKFIAGRRVSGGGDEGLGQSVAQGPWASELAAGELVHSIKQVAVRRIGGDAGRYVSSREVDGPRREIQLRAGLPPGARARVLDHELGHAIDHLAGTIPTKGMKGDLGRVYDHGVRGGANGGKPETPKSQGYKSAELADRELMAEALRA